MKIFRTFLLILLMVALVLWGSRFIDLYMDYQAESILKSYAAELDVPSKSVQFYPNMRYKSKTISYNMEDACDLQKINQIESALEILESKTVLRFTKLLSDPEIRFFCSEVAPTAEEKNHFVAGEGGPSRVIDGRNYAVILSGKASLYRVDKCSRPQIAIHEVLHVLGFDHNNNTKSILYPVTACDQEIDEYIIQEINSLYSIETNPDLIIDDAVVNYKGRYLNFDITIGNYGLDDSLSSILIVKADGETKWDSNKVNGVDAKLEIGSKKILSIENLDIGRDVKKVEFIIESNEEEISKENNIVTVDF